MRKLERICTAVAGVAPALLALSVAHAQTLTVGNPPPPVDGVPPIAAPANPPLYREGLPGVADVVAKPADNAAIDRFKSAYAARKNPRLIVFWNRALSDSTASNYRSDLRITARSERSATGSANMAAGWGQANASGGSSGTGTTTIDASAGRTAVEAMPRPGMAENQDWSAETSFTRTLIEAGAHIIDRAVAIRTTAAKEKPAKDEPTNQQYAEAAALLGKADILVEVLQTPDRENPMGFKFRVDVKEVQSGRVLASFITSALPSGDDGKEWVAGREGFQKSVRGSEADSAGRRLGVETMQALTRSWGGSS